MDRKLIPVIAGVVGIVVIAMGVWVIGTAITDEGGPNGEVTGEADELDVLPPELPDPEGDLRADVSCAPGETISWSEIETMTNGAEVAVVGEVTEVTSNDEGVTLALESDVPEQNDTVLEVLLTSTVTNVMPMSPEDTFEEQRVCVIGVIQEIQDAKLITVANIDDIQVQ